MIFSPVSALLVMVWVIRKTTLEICSWLPMGYNGGASSSASNPELHLPATRKQPVSADMMGPEDLQT